MSRRETQTIITEFYLSVSLTIRICIRQCTHKQATERRQRIETNAFNEQVLKCWRKTKTEHYVVCMLYMLYFLKRYDHNWGYLSIENSFLDVRKNKDTFLLTIHLITS